MAYWKDCKTLNKVLVIGDIMLDQYVIGQARQLCPEALAPVLEAVKTRCYPGGAANVAANIHSMGGLVTLAGVIGKDEEGETLKKILNQNNIPAVLGLDTTRPTTVKQRIGTREQLVVRLDREDIREISRGIFHDILKVVTILLDDVKVVSVSDYGNGVVTKQLIAAVCEISKSKGIPVLVDPKGTDFSKYRGVDLIIPSFQSVETLYGREIQDLKDMEESVKHVFSTTGCKVCIMTWGHFGAILFRSPKDWIHYPCRESWKLANHFSAGDVFMASLSMAISRGLSLEFACELANETAANAVSKVGMMVEDGFAWRNTCLEDEESEGSLPADFL